MKIASVRHIDGPNVYIYKPILVARIDLGHLAERESYEVPGFAGRLLSMFPGLRDHHCAKGAPGGFVERLYGGTYFGHIVEHVAIELACCAGLDVHYGKTVYAGELGHYDIILECKEFPCQKYLLLRAVDIVEGLIYGTEVDASESLDEARRMLSQTQLGPSTRAIAEAAQKRNIPVRRLSEGSLLQLGYGRFRKLVSATVTHNTSAVAVDVASDKELTKRILHQAGIPVPEGDVAETGAEAVEIFNRIGSPVVLKPFNGNQGRGVHLNLQSPEEVLTSYELSSVYSRKVVVERYISGRNIRVLVVDGRIVAASERIPARVLGDGQHTVQELIDELNRDERRGDDHEKPLTKISVDAIVEQTLRRQSLQLSDVPEAGSYVYLRESANLSTGGEAIDITDHLAATYRHIAERSARLVGLDVCGVDMVVDDPFTDKGAQRCAVIELNACPGIRMHEHPSYGSVRNVADDIVESLFPGNSDGRIPIVAITGTNGKTTTTRLIGHAVRQQGKVVGMTTTGGIYIDEEQIQAGDTTGPASASVVLSDPGVDVAVLETARGGIVRGGLAYDKASVAVLTNITLDHVGQDGCESIEDLVHIKSLIAECVLPDGTVVLNADDAQLVEVARRVTAKVVFFSSTDTNPVMKRHLAKGGVGYYVSHGFICEGRGSLSWEVTRVEGIPLTLGGTAEFQVENCLAATAALRSMGLTRQQVAHALETFTPARHNPGRCMLFEMPNGCHVVLDYGHNPDGFAKIGRWLKTCSKMRLFGVVGVPGDRANDVVRKSADRLADVFDAFIVKEDEDKRGRREGEVADMMARQIRNRVPEKPCTVVLSETEALRSAILNAEAGDVIAMFYEKLQPAVQVVEQLGGVAVTHIRQPRSRAVATV